MSNQNSRCYVGNLPFSTNKEELQALFEQVGEVIDATVMTDRDTGRSRGFGFVEMSSGDEANEAVSRFNGYSMGGRNLKVNIARPRENRPNRGGGGSYR